MIDRNGRNMFENGRASAARRSLLARYPTVRIASAWMLLAAAPVSAEQLSSVPDPEFPAALRALFDAPAETLRTLLPAKDKGDPDGIVRCFRYPRFTVQEVDFGEHGDQSIFVTPHHSGTPLPTCGPVPGRLEKTLFDSEQSYFVGAKGAFGFVQSTAGKDGIPFVIHNLDNNLALYGDDMATDTVPSRIDVAADVLRLQYVRAAKGSCSIVSDGRACWKSFSAEAKLPMAIANGPPPVKLCVKGYAAVRDRPVSADETSVLNYTVSVQINAAVEVDKVTWSGTLLSCVPQS